MIAASLNFEGEIVHTGQLQRLTLGTRDAVRRFCSRRREDVLRIGIRGDPQQSDCAGNVEKWAFIATNAGLTILMRAPIGDIVEAGGSDVAELFLDECNAIASASGDPVRSDVLRRFRKMFTAPGSPMTASLFRDLESGGRIEADHIIGDLLARAPQVPSAVILRGAYVHMKAYEARRRRLAEGEP